MANIKSAAKRAKQSIVRRDRNQQAKKAVRSLEKSVRAAIAAQDKNTPELMKAFESKLDKAAKKGMFHKNTASRKISRLTVSMQKALNA